MSGKPVLRLYVWSDDVFEQYTSGIAFALASSPEEARKLIREGGGGAIDDSSLCAGLNKEPDDVHEVDEPVAYFWGSD